MRSKLQARISAFGGRLITVHSLREVAENRRKMNCCFNQQPRHWMMNDMLAAMGADELIGNDEENDFIQHWLFKVEMGKSYKKMISAFNRTPDDKERVAITYSAMARQKKFDEDPMDPFNKNNEQADKYRQSGNEAFRDSNPLAMIVALDLFTRSIIAAKYPVSETDNWSSISLAFGNRSAVQFKLGQYDECLSDIDQAFKLRYPDKLKHKLYARQGECLHIMGKMAEAQSSFQDAIRCLDLASDLTPNARAGNLSRIQMHLAAITAGRPRREKYKPRVSRQLPQVADVANPAVPAASSCVEVAYDPQWGRYLRAARDIQPGEVLLAEEPYMALLRKEYYLSNCYTCLEQCSAMIPCKNCFVVMFCSEACRDESMTNNHDLECPGRWHFINVVEPNLTKLVMRVFIVAVKRHGGLRGLCDYIARMEASDSDERIKGFNEDGKYDSAGYATVHNLSYPVPEEYSEDIVFSMAMNSSYFLNFVLFQADFKDDLADEGVRRCVGGVFQRLQSVLKNNTVSIIRQMGEGRVVVGDALYPTMHLMNHACIANAFHYVHGKTAVVVASALIKKGDQIFLDYTQYSTEPRLRERGNAMYVLEPPLPAAVSAVQTSHRFTCSCRLCLLRASAVSYWADGRDWACLKCRASLPPRAQHYIKCPRCDGRNYIDRLRKDAEDRFAERLRLAGGCRTPVNVTQTVCEKLLELFGEADAPLHVVYDYQCMLKMNMSQEGKYLIRG